MKQITVKEECSFVRYEAVDGTIFDDENECALYEKTAKGVLNAAFNKLVKKRCDAWSLMGGYEDNEILVVDVKTAQDVATVLQRYYLDNYFILDDKYKDIKESVDSKVQKALDSKSPILIGVNAEGELYMLDTVDYYLNNLKDLLSIR